MIQITGRRQLTSTFKLENTKKPLTSMERDTILMASWRFVETWIDRSMWRRSNFALVTLDKLATTLSLSRPT